MRAWSWLGLIVLASACQPPITLGRVCTRSSECSAPLVCGNGRCREECLEHRDCPLASRCIAAHDGLGVCTLDDDECSASSPCSGDLQCRAGQCYDACATATCPAGGVCVAGVCERPEPGVDAGAEPDSGGMIDGGPPGFPQHQVCSSDAACATGEECTRLALGGSFYCRPSCATNGDCGVTDTANACVLMPSVAGPEVAVCGVPCELFGGGDCASGEACDLLEIATAPSRAVGFVVDCRPVDPAMRGQDEPCDVTGGSGYDPTLCEAGFDCDGVGPMFTCQQLCTVGGTLGEPCASGGACAQAGATPLRFRGATIGTCEPP